MSEHSNQEKNGKRVKSLIPLQGKIKVTETFIYNKYIIICKN